jgi:hypothetical protein
MPENANLIISPRTGDHLIAPCGRSAVVDVIVIVVIDATINTGAISHWQHRDDPWGRTNGRLLNHDALGDGAPLINDASRTRESRDERCDKKNGFHWLSKCYGRIAGAGHGAPKRLTTLRWNVGLPERSAHSCSTSCLGWKSKNLWKLSGGC